MKLHPRVAQVTAADSELNELLTGLILKYDLTYLELLQILAARTQRELKYMLRTERHPDNPTKKADEE